jgi:hypothetical protein
VVEILAALLDDDDHVEALVRGRPRIDKSGVDPF